MSLLNRLFGGGPAQSENPIPNNVVAPDFVGCKFGHNMMAMIYQKIMTEAADRASLPAGVAKEAYTLTMADSFSPAKTGLVSVLVEGMIKQSKRYFRVEETNRGDKLLIQVYGLEATDGQGNTKTGVIELDFSKFKEAQILELVFETLGLVLQAMANSTSISQAALFKIHKLSDMIANEQNIGPITAQLKQVNDAISKGQAGVIDAESSIEFAKVDMSPSQAAASFLFSIASTITGMPASYIFGEVVGGLGDTSTSDEKRANVALKRYFHSILAGALYSVFGKPFQYKTLIDDLPGMVELFTWLESTTLLTEDGKRKILLDNTALTEDDIDTSEPEPMAPAGPALVNGQPVQTGQPGQPAKAAPGAGVV